MRQLSFARKFFRSYKVNEVNQRDRKESHRYCDRLNFTFRRLIDSRWHPRDRRNDFERVYDRKTLRSQHF